MSAQDPIKAHFFIRGKEGRFAFRSLSQCPAIGERCVFNEKRFAVAIVEWCLDADASNLGGTRVNIELEERKS